MRRIAQKTFNLTARARANEARARALGSGGASDPCAQSEAIVMILLT